jgi:hypothetical protein
VTEAAASLLPVNQIVRAMRRAGADGKPVPPTQVQQWVDDLFVQLYGTQKPVRIETRKRNSTMPWVKAEHQDIAGAPGNGMEFRALYLHPKTEQPAKKHRRDADNSRCVDCGELLSISGPDCRTDYYAPDPRLTQAITLSWFKEPLEVLQSITSRLNRFDRDKWNREVPFLLNRIAQYEKESRS